MALLNTADAIYRGAAAADKVYLGTVQVWPPEVTAEEGFAGSVMVMGLFPVTVTGSGTRESDVGGAMMNV